MSIYKFRGSGTGGTEDSNASIDIQAVGTITAMHMSMTADLDADLEFCIAEISFLSSNTVGVNDARGSLMIVATANSQAAAGTTVPAVNSGVSNVGIPVNQGERVHLHINATAGVTSVVHGYLYVDDALDQQRTRRR